MNKFIFLIIIFILNNLIHAQNKYEVDNFSSDYFGIIQITKFEDFENSVWIAIYDKNTNEELIKVEAERIFLELHNGKVVANIKELPYGEQSLIIYEDFNFDGVNDFAIEDGTHSCYGGPSYKIYLADNEKFVYNDKFTELAQNYCGMFYVDHEKKTISTMNKSGCCYHEFSEFKVENNIPKIFFVIIEDASQDNEYVTITTKKLNNGKWNKTIKKIKQKDYFKN